MDANLNFLPTSAPNPLSIGETSSPSVGQKSGEKTMLGKEFATLQLIDWIRKGDVRLVDRYLDTQLGGINLNGHTSRVRTPFVV
mgnify:CR=1 FL=1